MQTSTTRGKRTVRVANLLGVAILSVLVILMFLVQAGVASSGWSQIVEGDGYDALFPHSVIQTSDGGYVMAVFADTKRIAEGSSWMLEEQYELWLVKTDSSGVVQWKQVCGTEPTVSGEVYTVVQTNDGGYAVGGYAMGNAWWLIKTDSSGRTQWDKTYTNNEGGDPSNSFSHAYSMILTKDGGFALAGAAHQVSSGGTADFCLLKVDSAGNMQWTKTYDGGTYREASGTLVNTEDEAYSVVQTSDGGFALSGQSKGSETSDFWLVKTDSLGKMQWNTKYWEPYLPGGRHFLEVTHKAIQTSDGGYALTGSEEKSVDDNDFYLIKVDSSGGMQWRKTYGAKYLDVPCAVVQLSDSGFAIGGTVTEVGKTDPVSKDFGIVRTDSSGNQLWFKEYNAKINDTLGGLKSEEFAYAMSRTQDGAYVIAGTTQNAWDGSHVDIFLVKSETLETPLDTTPTTSLGEVTGKLDLQAIGQDSWTQAVNGASLTEGMKIRTAESDFASFTLSETATLQLNPRTLIEVKASTGNSQRLQLVQGEFKATVRDLPAGATFSVEMSQAEVTVKGTVFTVTENGSESKLTVQDGVVTFTSKTNGASVDVAAGQSATATANGLGDAEQGGVPYVVVVVVVALVALLAVTVWMRRRRKTEAS